MNTKFIQSQPSTMMGKPVIKGTRITVELILEKLAAGETVEQLLEAHPRLTKKGIQAALSFNHARIIVEADRVIMAKEKRVLCRKLRPRWTMNFVQSTI